MATQLQQWRRKEVFLGVTGFSLSSFCSLSQPQVTQLMATLGALRVFSIEHWPAARPRVRSWTLRWSFVAVDIREVSPRSLVT